MNRPLFQGPSAWPSVASDLGFEFDPARSRDSAFRNGTVLREEGSWLALVERAPLAGDPLHEPMGTPGLWRVMRERQAEGTRCVRVFDLPAILAVAPFDDEREPHPAEAGQTAVSELAWLELIEWADLTAKGCAPSGWTAPSRDEVEQWVTPVQLRVRAGAQAVEGSVICEAGRLALSMPSLARIPADLSPARLEWVSELCHSAQEHWHMVRVGADSAAASVAAEVDLTGAPESCLPALLELAHGALLNAVTWVLPALALATNSSIESLMLDRHPWRAAPRLTHPTRRVQQADNQTGKQPKENVHAATSQP